MELTCVSPWKRMDLDLPIRGLSAGVSACVVRPDVCRLTDVRSWRWRSRQRQQPRTGPRRYEWRCPASPAIWSSVRPLRASRRCTLRTTARSVCSQGARDRQTGIGAEPFVVPGLTESATLLLPPESRRSVRQGWVTERGQRRRSALGDGACAAAVMSPSCCFSGSRSPRLLDAEAASGVAFISGGAAVSV
jgi:hypothetical protein